MFMYIESPVPDPDLEIKGGGRGGGGEGWRSTRPKIFFSALRAPVWFKNKGGGPPTPSLDPPLKSMTKRL